MLEAGDKLQTTTDCPRCGGQSNMSVAKNKTIYMYCNTIIDPETCQKNGQEKGEKCGRRIFEGRAFSKQIIREYNNNYEEYEGIEHVQDEPKQQPAEAIGEEGDVGTANVPAPIPVQPAKSSGGGFFSGLVGGDSFLA